MCSTVMAGGSDVVKRVLRFKLQLTDSAESATVLKILQKLKDLDITLDILAETGIGKTVNSLRRHSEAGDLAKSLVRGWKQLVPKKSLSHIEDGNVSDMSVKDNLDNQNTEVLAMEDSNKCISSHGNNLESSNEHLSRITHVMKSKEPQKRKLDQQESVSNECIWENVTQSEKNALLGEKMDDSLVSKENKYHHCKSDCDRTFGNKNSLHKSRKDSKERLNSSSSFGSFRSEKQAKSKPSKKLSQDNELLSESEDKYLFKTLKKVKHEKLSGKSSSSITQKSKRRKEERKKPVEFKEESEYKEHSKPLNKKNKLKQEENESEFEEPSMSFESYLNYDENFSRRKEGPCIKKSTKKLKMVVREEQSIDTVITPVKSLSSQDLFLSSKQKFKESVVDQFNNPLPTSLSDFEKRSGIVHIEKKVQREPDCSDITEDSAVFTGQRHYKKMQVYSGSKTVFLPSMMSLYQQCIRTLQNNINLLYETGGVPFEILEPVLERCTPEQLLRIEEYNPVYMGTTDHLWGKHCQRDFKDSKLQEYESWKEMYIRLSEERERKLQALTKTIVSAHSMKPKGRQVKMAFIHTVAKPPREVRIQQEIHGTAVQLPQLSVKAQENRSRSSNEPSRPSNTISGSNNTQDTRKKTRVAPIMAKSLRAFKKQLGRR